MNHGYNEFFRNPILDTSEPVRNFCAMMGEMVALVTEKLPQLDNIMAAWFIFGDAVKKTKRGGRHFLRFPIDDTRFVREYLLRAMRDVAAKYPEFEVKIEKVKRGTYWCDVIVRFDSEDLIRWSMTTIMGYQTQPNNYEIRRSPVELSLEEVTNMYKYADVGCLRLPPPVSPRREKEDATERKSEGRLRRIPGGYRRVF